MKKIRKKELLILMKDLNVSLNILFSTHILSDADEVSDELLLLNEGKLIESGSILELRSKYQTTVIELQFQNDLQSYQEKVDTLPSILNTTVNRNTLHVTVTDSIQARKEILSEASANNWNLTGFSINRASLEDMFMRVIQS